MDSKKKLIFFLVFLMPLFAKEGPAILKKGKKQYVCEAAKPDLPDKNYIEPLLTDNKTTSNTLALFYVKSKLNQDLGYDFIDTAFVIKSYEDSSVRYTRPDGSGFVRMSGSRTWRNQNPGAIRTSPFTRKMGAVGDAGGFAVFPSEEHGMIALKTLLRTDAYSNLSIYDAIHKYAPFCDNNDPVRYQRHLYAKTGIDVNRKLKDLSDAELDKIADTIKILEGWKIGNLSSFGVLSDLLQEINSEQNQRTL